MILHLAVLVELLLLRPVTDKQTEVGATAYTMLK